MNHSALINGEPAETLPITDRGLQYGDGLFETIAVVSGRLLCWDDHLTRLEAGCRRLHIKFPGRQPLTEEAHRLSAQKEQGVLKLILTRGCGGRGYAPNADAGPNRILSLHPWPAYPLANRKQGVRIRVCNSRLGGNSLLAGMKHLNRLEQVMARTEWQDPAIAEGLMLDREDNIIEGTMSNLFVCRQGILMTPAVDKAGVAGIIRARVLAIAAALDLETRVTTLTMQDINTADELFLCNSLIGIWPVCAVEAKSYMPGPLTRSIREHLIREGAISPD